MKNLNISAQSLYFLWPPTIETPFQVRLELQTNSPELRAVGDFLVADCISAADAVQRTKALLEALSIVPNQSFVLVYPMFPGNNDREEALVVDRSWEIKMLADEEGWDFSRYAPASLF